MLWGVFFTANLFYQPYFKELNLPLAYFGVIFAALCGASAIGARYAHDIEEKIGEKKILIALLLFALLSYLGMSYISSLFALVFPIMISVIIGVFEPVIVDYLQRHVESHHRATVTSLSSFATQGTGAVFAPFFGYIADVYTLQTAFLLAGAIIGLNLFILSMMYVYGWRRLRNGEKEII